MSSEVFRLKKNCVTNTIINSTVFGCFLDDNPRTINDRNEIHDCGDGTAKIDLYNAMSECVAQAIIDSTDIQRVQSYKWRISKKRHKTYVIQGSGSNQTYLARFILNYDGPLEVDHINGDSLDNRKCNLRIVTRQANTLNLCAKDSSQTQIRGVSYSVRDKLYKVDFRIHGARLYFKGFQTLAEAAYLRLLCEEHYLGEYRNHENVKQIASAIQSLTDAQKETIHSYFQMKTGGVPDESFSTCG